ncbi:MAG: Methionine ABC transporter substrate-binding protein [uncultured Paraburkholderia sp.]|nr:MAG: Methionine ABC transporter substrate-binding protein [uncultured Paraburkholderia sp.]
MQRRNILKALSAVIAGAAIVTSFGAHADEKVIKVGTISGPDAQIWEVVRKVAKREGLNVKVVEFNDYVQPNAALDAGDLDANSFRHQPYLDSQIKQRGYKIVSAGLTYISPLGIYSRKLKSVKDLPQGAKVAVPNDPSNENRALLLLQAQGVIKLKAGAGTNGNNATALDVADNPKKIKLVELDAAQLPRSLADVDEQVESFAAGGFVSPVAGAAVPRAQRYIVALGGASNLSVVDACTTRLRLSVVDSNKVSENELKTIGARRAQARRDQCAGDHRAGSGHHRRRDPHRQSGRAAALLIVPLLVRQSPRRRLL